jgi:hypothetical protein
LASAAPIERFVDLDAGLAVDRPNQSNLPDPNYINERFVLAANGDAFIHVHEIGEIVGPTFTLQESWAELVALPGGQSGRRFDNLTTGQLITGDPLIAANGKVGWIYTQAGEFCPDFPFPVSCVRSSTAVAILANGNRTFDTGPNPRGSMDISAHGRFLVFDKFTEPSGFSSTRGPVRVIDWVTGTVEFLSQGSPSLTTDGQISDDQRVVATTTNDGGWYEYAAAST